MFQLESRDDLGRILAFPLVKVRTSIGRDPACDIVLTDEDVSRRHARIYVIDNAVKVKDEGSANGTYVNNMPITDMTDLPVGGEIILGSNLFYLRQVDAAPEDDRVQLTTMLSLDQLRDMTHSFAALLDDPPPAGTAGETVIADRRMLIENIYHKQIAFRAHPTLEVIFGPDKGKKFVLTPGEHRLGRGPNCNIRLEDPMVSALHGVVAVDDEKSIYADEGSRNGSVLNNKIVDTHPLHNRDVLVIGATKLKFTNPRERREVGHAPTPLPAAPVGRNPWWEQHRIWVGVGSIAFLLLVLIALWRFWR